MPYGVPIPIPAPRPKTHAIKERKTDTGEHTKLGIQIRADRACGLETLAGHAGPCCRLRHKSPCLTTGARTPEPPRYPGRFRAVGTGTRGVDRRRMGAGPITPATPAATDRPAAPRPPHHPERDRVGHADPLFLAGLPLEFGKWETAYKRYRLWQDTGRWPRLLALLADDPVTPLTEVTL